MVNPFQLKPISNLHSQLTTKSPQSPKPFSPLGFLRKPTDAGVSSHFSRRLPPLFRHSLRRRRDRLFPPRQRKASGKSVSSQRGEGPPFTANSMGWVASPFLSPIQSVASSMGLFMGNCQGEAMG